MVFTEHDTSQYSSKELSNAVADKISTVNESQEDSDNSKETSCFVDRFKKSKLEIFAFLFTFSYVLAKVSSTAMILEKVCLAHLQYNYSICNNLDNYTDIKSSVVKLATNYQLGHTLIQTAPAAVLACFVGPWSDRYGRKFPIILSTIGMLLDSATSTVCAYVLESRVEYYFVPALFSGLSGGSVTTMAVVYSFCSDSSTLLQRTLKYAFIEMSVGLGTAFGSSVGGWIYKGLGFPAVFLFSSGGLIVSLAFGYFLIKETRGLDNHDTWAVKLRNLASCSILMEGFGAISRKRPEKGRAQVVLLIISICFLVIAMNSTGDINFLYAHHQFGWDDTTYSNAMSIYTIVGIAVLVIIIPLLRYFRIPPTYLGLFGTASLIGKCLGVGLSQKVIGYHVANVIGVLGGCATFAGRARISILAQADELGKIFTFVATAESLLPILTSVLMSQIFVACLNFFPGMPYITLAALLLFPQAVFCWLKCLPNMSYQSAGRNHSTAQEGGAQTVDTE